MTILTLFAFTIRQTLGQRKLWLAAALLALPSAIVMLVRVIGGTQAPEHRWEMYHELMRMMIMILVPLVCMLYGTALIGAEIEQRTFVYLVTRRLHRATVLLVRYAATWLVLTTLCELALLAAHFCLTAGSGAIPMPGSGDAWQPWPDLLCYALVVIAAVAGYLAVFTAISLIFTRSLIVSVVYFVLLEMMLGNAPLGASALSLNHHLQKTIMHGIPATRSLRPGSEEMLDQLFPPGESGTQTVLLTVVVLLALGGTLVTLREMTPARVGRD
jgi:ABC-2 type transport system permease protein